MWTAEGWLYLAVIMDLHLRRIVGWATARRLHRQLALDALEMALAQRAVAEDLIHHSDRGSQYASDEYQARLNALHVICSMSRRGNCWDNAVVESFFATLKTELIHGASYATRREAAEAIFEYIEVFYNWQRRHSSLGYVSPVEFEEQRLPAA